MAWFCWHEWTPWKHYIVEVFSTLTPNVKGQQTWQRRSCTKCGKVQARFVCKGGWEEGDA